MTFLPATLLLTPTVTKAEIFPSRKNLHCQCRMETEFQSFIWISLKDCAKALTVKSTTNATYVDEITKRGAYTKNTLCLREKQSLGQIVDILV